MIGFTDNQNNTSPINNDASTKSILSILPHQYPQHKKHEDHRDYQQFIDVGLQPECYLSHFSFFTIQTSISPHGNRLERSNS